MSGISDETRELLATSTSIAANLLTAGEYDTLESASHGQYMNAMQLRSAVEAYGESLVRPPDSAFDHIEIQEVPGADPPEYEVHFDLWTASGESDLTLILRLVERLPGYFGFSILNIHVQ